MPLVSRVTGADGDWEAVYIDGKLVEQHHHVELRDVVEALGCAYEHFEVEQDYLEANLLPDSMAEIPKDVRF